LEVVYDVPSRLPDLLNAGRVDAALVPVIDLARFGSRWDIVSDACIGCDGETLTVRVFSRVPPEQITQLHVDGDSHTSVALARVLWNQNYETQLQISRFQPWETQQCQAVLLIGDKVVTHRFERFDHQIDLGSAWKQLTGLPFVFATWARLAANEVGDLGTLLSRARDLGLARASAIAAEQGPARGWSADQAEHYLTQHLSFTLTPRHRRGMELFLEMVGKRHIVSPAIGTVST
jgi:chorismate dehydratase